MLLMNSTGPRLSAQVPHWRRACVHAAVVVGIFAMHQLLAGQAHGPSAPHGGMDMTSTAAPAQHASTQPAVEPLSGDSEGVLSDCGALVALCFAVIVGIGAVIVFRRWMSERVLWHLPPPIRILAALSVPPFHGLSPRHRNFLLRC